VPEKDGTKTNKEMTKEILNLWKPILSYFAGVLIILVYWSAHIFLFSLIQGADSTIAFLNLFFLMSSSFIPFAAGVAAEWPNEFYSSLVVNCVLLGMGVSLLVIWIYVIFRRRFIHDADEIPTHTLVAITIRLLFPPTLYAISIGAGAGSTWASLAVTMTPFCIFSLGMILGVDFFALLVHVCIKLWNRCCNRVETADSATHINETKIHYGTSLDTNADALVEKKPFMESREFHDLIAERIKGYGDAVFAIVITILILQLHVPSQSGGDHSRRIEPRNNWEKNKILGHGLAALWPVYISYFISVILVGTYWKSHAYTLRGIIKTDRTFVFLNVIFLAFVSLIPLASILLGRFSYLTVSAVFFNMLLFVCSMVLFLMFAWSNFRDRLRTTTFRFKILALIRIFSGPIIMLVATGIAFANVYASIAISMLYPLLELLSAFELDLYKLIWLVLFWVVDRVRPKKEESEKTV
jgi:uncharacterized membrane protein